MTPAARHRVGVVGLGNMGLPCARTLVRAGLDVIAYDVRSEPLDELERHGATRATALADLRECSSVALFVLDDDQVRSVAAALLPLLSPGAAVAVHSTVRPATVHAVDELARERDVAIIDAPVSGGSFNAERGDLTLMVGGPWEAIERCRPHLEPLGTICRMGDLGAGEVAKLANNLMQNGHWSLLCEALALSAACGISQAALREVVSESSGASWSLEHLDHLDDLIGKHRMADDPRFAGTFRKDSWAAVAIAHDAGLSVPVAALVQERLPGLLARRRRSITAVTRATP